jgi:hypothetical protein
MISVRKNFISWGKHELGEYSRAAYNNIDDLHLYEEDDFKSSKEDVWGISDKNLFLESNKILANKAEAIFRNYSNGRQSSTIHYPSRRQEAAFEMKGYPADSLNKIRVCYTG